MVAHSRAPVRTDRLRALNVPEPVRVELDAVGRPTAVRRSGGQETKAAVETILDTWRMDDEWWRQPISRRNFAVVLEGGQRVVLFEDLVTGDWFAQKP